MSGRFKAYIYQMPDGSYHLDTYEHGEQEKHVTHRKFAGWPAVQELAAMQRRVMDALVAEKNRDC